MSITVPRDFKGVWIPKDLWLDDGISLQDKCLIAEIDSLSLTDDGCYASNTHFAKFLGVGEDRAKRIISNLVDKGYVERNITYKNGTKEVDRRYLRVMKHHEGGGVAHTEGGGAVRPIENTVIEHSKRNIYKHPSLEEVRSHVKAKGYHFSADEFYNYYSSANWHKANGQPVRSWKQCCITWESNHKPTQTVVEDTRKRLK